MAKILNTTESNIRKYKTGQTPYNWTVFEILKNRVNIPPYSYCVLKLIKQPLFVIIILGK